MTAFKFSKNMQSKYLLGEAPRVRRVFHLDRQTNELIKRWLKEKRSLGDVIDCAVAHADRTGFKPKKDLAEYK